MLERSEASTTAANLSCWNEVKHLQQTHNKRFFRAKPSTTRLTTYRNDKYVKTPALSSRQSVATRDLNKTYTEIPHTRLTLAPTGVDLRFGMTKQRFVIGEFIGVTMNEPMLFCFVIGEFIGLTMNEPMLFCFVIDEFCSNRSNVALPPLRQ